MLCSTICALMLSSAAGATVQAEVSVRGAQSVEELLEDGAHGNGFETLDVGALTPETTEAFEIGCLGST